MCKALASRHETKKYRRIHGAWSVGLIAGDNYVAVGSQRFTQGEIDNFDVCVRVVVSGAILGVINNGVSYLRWKQAHKTNAAGNFASFDAKFAMLR
jgi:hypothetical protein